MSDIALDLAEKRYDWAYIRAALDAYADYHEAECNPLISNTVRACLGVLPGAALDEGAPVIDMRPTGKALEST